MNTVLTAKNFRQKTDHLLLVTGLTEQLLESHALKPVQFDVESRTQAFLNAWLKGVQFVGEQWFVDDPWGPDATKACYSPSPNVLRLGEALESLGGAQRLFFSLMVSFYCPREGQAMLRQCGFCGMADLACLDLIRRQIIADLVALYGTVDDELCQI